MRGFGIVPQTGPEILHLLASCSILGKCGGDFAQERSALPDEDSVGMGLCGFERGRRNSFARWNKMFLVDHSASSRANGSREGARDVDAIGGVWHKRGKRQMALACGIAYNTVDLILRLKAQEIYAIARDATIEI